MDTHKQSSQGWVSAPDARRKARFKLAVDVTVISKTCGRLPGRTVDLSESGLAAILKLEVPVGELVELEFALPHGLVRLWATVRQRNAFRYGFHFVESAAEQQIIHATCRSLEVEQSLRRIAALKAHEELE